MGAGRLRVLLRVVVVGAILMSALVLRVVTASARELAAGEAYLEQGDSVAAIVHLRRAARWYAPGSPYHLRALATLGRIAEVAESQGDVELSLSGYRAIRAAILSARSFYIPERARLEAANSRIADLMASLPPPPMDAGKTREQLRKEHLALLRESRDPATGWSLLLLLGLFTWVVGGHMFCLRAVDGERYVPAEARRWGTVIVLGLGTFLLGLAMA